MFADSPLTSTYFADVYKNEVVVQKALNAQGVLTVEIMDYLANPENPVAVKIAALNAISWQAEVDNYTLFLSYLKKQYGLQSEISLLNALDGGTLASLAYVKGLSNYFDVDDAIFIAQIACGKSEKSFTVNMVFALLCAQKLLDVQEMWGSIYEVCNWVVNNQELTQDMHPKAIEQIMEYINIYAEENQ
jgi:hypothetical protein